jgi:hypothetical protein
MLIKPKDILKYYPTLRMWAEHLVPSAYRSILDEQLIKEFLYTIDPLKTTNQLNKQLGYGIVYADWLKRDDKIIQIRLVFKNPLKEDITRVCKLMDKFGWYPSFIEDNKNGGKFTSKVKDFLEFKGVNILFEPKYEDKEVKIKEHFLYHLTPDLKWPRIKFQGITPKSQEKLSNHPSRVYLLKNIDNLEEHGGKIEDISFILLNHYPYKDMVKEMYLLKIDTIKLLPKTIFFKDNNFYMGEAVWTYSNIPPIAITIERKINIIG